MVVTETVGTSVSGYSRTGRRWNESMPNKMRIRAPTIVRTGRLIDVSETIMENMGFGISTLKSFQLAVGGLGRTGFHDGFDRL